MNRPIGSTAKDIEELALLIMEGFEGKFQTLKFSVSEQKIVLSCLSEHILKHHSDHLLILKDKSIQGVLFMKPKKWGVMDLWKRLFKKVRLRTSLKTLIFLSAFHHSSAAKEIHIDFIAVSKYCRGKGLGTQLIEMVKNRLTDGAYITLYVSAANDSARRLYERLGFQVTEKGTSITGRHLHGIRQWYFMEWRGSKNEKGT